MKITIRDGSAADVPAVLGMLDRSVAWLAAQGRTGQWGTEPWSSNPRRVDLVHGYVTEGALYIAELAGVPAGALALSDLPGSAVPRVDEPERFIRLLVTDRPFKGHDVGGTLLTHAAEETRRAGISLLRLDCYAGDDRRLVAYYESQGFSPTEEFTAGEHRWPGQVLERRV